MLFVILQTTNNNTCRIMEDKLHTTNLEQIARFAKAMGHPTRIAILAFLAKQDSCFFGDIHEELPIAKATVSQHLKRSEEHTSELQSRQYLVCRLLLEKKKANPQ